jgi:hypothetical protein
MAAAVHLSYDCLAATPASEIDALGCVWEEEVFETRLREVK